MPAAKSPLLNQWGEEILGQITITADIVTGEDSVGMEPPETYLVLRFVKAELAAADPEEAARIDLPGYLVYALDGDIDPDNLIHEAIRSFPHEES